MADKMTRTRVCDVPGCPTPEDDVRRIESTMEGEGTVVMDLCRTDRAPLMELRQHAHRRTRRRGIQITDPHDYKKGS